MYDGQCQDRELVKLDYPGTRGERDGDLTSRPQLKANILVPSSGAGVH